jgi:hypothetical protein
LTLNLLRQSQINPRLSSQAQLNGACNFNKTPLAPPGTRVIIHEQTGVRRTWSVHGTDGWYLGPAPEHYRCYTVYCSKTGSERIIDTVEFFPANIRMPHMSSADNATTAAKELTHALLNPAPAAPFATIGNGLKSRAQTARAHLPASHHTKQTKVPGPSLAEPLAITEGDRTNIVLHPATSEGVFALSLQHTRAGTPKSGDLDSPDPVLPNSAPS